MFWKGLFQALGRSSLHLLVFDIIDVHFDIINVHPEQLQTVMSCPFFYEVAARLALLLVIIVIFIFALFLTIRHRHHTAKWLCKSELILEFFSDTPLKILMRLLHFKHLLAKSRLLLLHF